MWPKDHLNSQIGMVLASAYAKVRAQTGAGWHLAGVLEDWWMASDEITAQRMGPGRPSQRMDRILPLYFDELAQGSRGYDVVLAP